MRISLLPKDWLGLDEEDAAKEDVTEIPESERAPVSFRGPEPLKERPNPQNERMPMAICIPAVYEDCKVIADKLKAQEIVIVNYNMTTESEARRVFYFTKGVIYALGGSCEKVAENVFTYTPKTVSVQNPKGSRSPEDTLRFSWKNV